MKASNCTSWFLHGPLCTTLVSKFFISSIMTQPIQRVPISIMPKVASHLLWYCRKKRKRTKKKLTLFTTDIFQFTLYWTLIFYTPIFLFCGSYAFWNYAFPPSPHLPTSPTSRDSTYQLSTFVSNTPMPLIQPPKPQKPNERRSRVAFAVIVLMTFLILGVAGAVVGSAILGFVAAGLYKSASFNMSTCVMHFHLFVAYSFDAQLCLVGYLSCLLCCRSLLNFSGKSDIGFVSLTGCDITRCI